MPAVVKQQVFGYSDGDILGHVAELLSDGTMAFKVNIIGESITIGQVQIENSEGNIIDPATEENQQAVIAILDNLTFSGGALVVTSTAVTPGTWTFLENESIEPNATAYNDYTVPVGYTFSLSQVFASASGQIKVVVSVGATMDSLVPQLVGFNTASNPNVDLKAANALSVPAGYVVSVALTNMCPSTINLYSTIIGSLSS